MKKYLIIVILLLTSCRTTTDSDSIQGWQDREPGGMAAGAVMERGLRGADGLEWVNE